MFPMIDVRLAGNLITCFSESRIVVEILSGRIHEAVVVFTAAAILVAEPYLPPHPQWRSPISRTIWRYSAYVIL